MFLCYNTILLLCYYDIMLLGCSVISNFPFFAQKVSLIGSPPLPNFKFESNLSRIWVARKGCCVSPLRVCIKIVGCLIAAQHPTLRALKVQSKEVTDYLTCKNGWIFSEFHWHPLPRLHCQVTRASCFAVTHARDSLGWPLDSSS